MFGVVAVVAVVSVCEASLYSISVCVLLVTRPGWRAKVWFVGFVPLCIFISACKNISALARLFHPITEEVAPLPRTLMSHLLEYRT